mmetsp:Transcript_22380/g.34783  ORF Transcript_22380/g.34783 Transcript_22380/m.34783 type:complete len:362 (-) Transcript_22380:41-1126(-)|eukprot:CAMPEP_0201521472 /NCGR_PEP_ID=MMETSP0161_2-20130828/14440_1 /ASSEMBLY_ACC=CAM_ASM_000251 /TAXON_ID=180227 /ORGANISM="Neoparamoeba aestuarina, Strain SoJaBio B1-5/56/2" /LENGTH=361 /DNA_ID=CAMNT_0047920115 /DNA_START=109 /DNA_END=1194 /DNA_ORIENTATION=-
MKSFYDFANSVGRGTFSKEEGTFDSQVSQALPAEVRMFSGCSDEQTSSDVKNTKKFGLEPASGPSGAGGACTNSLLLSLQENPDQTWSELLLSMRKILKEKKYKQVPQLSASQNVNLHTPFTLHNPKEKELKGKKRALLIGINYEHQPIALRGCINDIRKMEVMLKKEGFRDIKLLSDEDEDPTVVGIISAIMWLVDGAAPGDSLFMHFSGHGGRVEDDDYDEKDGYDETIIPVDYKKNGQIRDDDLFSLLIAPLPKDVHLTVVMDCCHSGTILDLPYTVTFSKDGTLMAKAGDGDGEMGMNPRFGGGRLMRLGETLFQRVDKMHKIVEVSKKPTRRSANKMLILIAVLVLLAALCFVFDI